MFGMSRMFLAVTRALDDDQKAFDITIDHTIVDEDLYDFPLLINLDTTSGIDVFDSTNVFSELNSPHQYWRIYITANGGDTGYTRFDEMELYTTTGGIDQTVPDGAGQIITDSSNFGVGYEGDKLFNNTIDSPGWITATGEEVPSWVEYDTNTLSDIIVIKFTIRACSDSSNYQNRNPKDFVLQYSDNGTDWVDHINVTGQLAWGNSEVRTFTVDGVIDNVLKIKTTYKETIGGLDDSIPSQIVKVEIDRWDQVNEQAQLWVKIPYISKDVDTVINLSYDSTNADNSTNIGITGSTPGKAVWSKYDAVYHLSADGADSAVNSLNGTLNGGIDSTNIVDFGIGKGMTFDGSTEYITLPDLAFGSTTALSWEIYALAASDAYMQLLAINNNTTTDNAYIGMAINSLSVVDNVQTYVNHNTTAQDNIFATGVDVSTIHSYSNTSSEDSVLLSYVDGTLKTTSGTGSGGYTTFAGNNINNIGLSNDGVSRFLNGTLKEVRFSKDLKTAGWVGTNYESIQDSLVIYENADAFILYYSLILSLNPLVYWRLGEVSGTTAYDETGNYDGTYTEDASGLTTTGLLVNDDNTAIAFTNTKYMDSASGTIINASNPHSFSFLFNRTSSADSHILNIPSSSNTLVITQVGTNPSQYGELAFGNGGFTLGRITWGLVNDQIYHVVLSWSGSAWVAYIDGVSQTITTPAGIGNESAVNILISKRNTTGSNGFNGIIDEVAIFNTALTQSQVTALYNSSIYDA